MGTEFWAKKIAKKMVNIRINCVKTDETRKIKVRPGYENANVHMIFEIEMGRNLNRKARLVADGHKTEPSK